MKIKLISSVLLCMILCSCNAEPNEKNNIISVSERSDNVSSTVTSEIPSTDEIVFNGLDKGDDIAYGNTSSSLNMGGILYNGDAKIIGGSSLIVNGVRLNYAAQGINYLDDKIYFIDSSNNNKVCSISVSGDNYSEIIEAQTSFLMVSEDSMIFFDKNNSLYIKSAESVNNISDKNVAWVNPYGEWLIFTELKSKCGVFAYNIKTTEKVKVLEYGFSLTVYNDYLYFQDNSGYINRLDLKNGVEEPVVEKWGQKFCFIDEVMYFVGADIINQYNLSTGELRELYKPEISETIIDSLFVCDNKLYYTERIKDTTMLLNIDIEFGIIEAVL